MAYVKFREVGKRQFLFLTPHGDGNRLRIHAARFETIEKAQQVIDENCPDNPGFEFKAVEA